MDEENKATELGVTEAPATGQALTATETPVVPAPEALPTPALTVEPITMPDSIPESTPVIAPAAPAPEPSMSGGVFSGSNDPAVVPNDPVPAFGGKSVIKDGMSLTKKLVIGGAALVVALGVGASAWFVVQNNDDKLIGDALVNLLQDNDVRVEGTVAVSNFNDDDEISARFNIHTRMDVAGRNSETSIGLYVRPTIAEVEALDGSREFGGTFYMTYVNENIFMRADYLQIVQQIVSAVAPDGADVAWPEEIARFNNTWLMIPNQTISDFTGSETENLQYCIQNQIEATRESRGAGREIFDMLTTIVRFERESRRSGVVTYNVSPSNVLADYVTFLEKVRDSDVVRGFVGCADNFQDGLAEYLFEMLDDAIGGFNEMTTVEREEAERTLQEEIENFPTITLEINTRTRRFTGMTIQGSIEDMEIVVSLTLDSRHDRSITIVAPSEYLELTGDDLDGLGELDINQILNAGATAEQRAAVSRVLESLEAFQADHNGVLPLLAIDASTGLIDEEDDFFADYILMRGGFGFNLRLLNSGNQTAFPGAYASMTYNRPFFLQDLMAGRADSIRYARFGESSGDIWLIYGATCRPGVSNVVDRAQGRTVSIMTYLGSGLYYCLDNTN
ncbi:hypothetical protein FWC63_00680 [Candidatus Saccharibacteria bacterium]|nr:hypothetical protein [Candidatus Saccharibacteria bacterium]